MPVSADGRVDDCGRSARPHVSRPLWRSHRSLHDVRSTVSPSRPVEACPLVRATNTDSFKAVGEYAREECRCRSEGEKAVDTRARHSSTMRSLREAHGRPEEARIALSLAPALRPGRATQPWQAALARPAGDDLPTFSRGPCCGLLENFTGGAFEAHTVWAARRVGCTLYAPRMSATQAEQDLLRLLASVNERELHDACIDSMRGCVGRSNPHLHIRDFIGPLLERLVQLQPGVASSSIADMRAILTHCLSGQRCELSRLADFMWWLVRAGLGIPRMSPDGWDVPSVVLTDAGWQFVETHSPHPLLPGTVARLEAACPGLPDHVVELLTDAVECCAYGLNRAAVALLGFAYEGAIDEVLDRLDTKGHVKKDKLPFQAGDRLKLLRSKLSAVYPDSGDPGSAKLIHSGTLKLIHPFVQWSPAA